MSVDTASKTGKAAANKAIAEAKAVADAIAEETSDQELHAEIVVESFEQLTAYIPIVGISPLIQHRFDEKAIKMILESMEGKKTIKAKREPKDPVAEYERAKYLLENGLPGHPVTAFKIATVDACSLFPKEVTKVAVKRALFFRGEGPDMLVPIQFEDCTMREDTVRVGMGSVDLRYRPSYEGWSCTLAVDYLPHVINLASVVTLVNAGGLGGVGEWRPSAPKSSGGVFGRYEVDKTRDISTKAVSV